MSTDSRVSSSHFFFCPLVHSTRNTSQERSTRPVYRIDAEEAAAKDAGQVSSSQYSTVPSSSHGGASKPAALASLFEAPQSSAAAASTSASAVSTSASNADGISAINRVSSTLTSSSSALVADLIAADTSADAVRAAIAAELAHEREGVFAAFHHDFEYRGPSELLVGRREAGALSAMRSTNSIPTIAHDCIHSFVSAIKTKFGLSSDFPTKQNSQFSTPC